MDAFNKAHDAFGRARRPVLLAHGGRVRLIRAKDEDELRTLWGQPDTREALLESLSEKGYGDEQLSEIKRMIDAEKCDLCDVLAYIAFALSPSRGWSGLMRADIFPLR